MKFFLKRRILAALFAVTILLGKGQVWAAEPEIASPSAILMEQSTGKIIYEKNADERRSPASVTKIMTLYLIFESLEQGRISLEDEVVTSAYAKSMGGSQVFLEEGEIQTVETLIKCITIASGNDASVVMAEYIAGSEASFVEKMNQKAAELGMNDTNFVDCCGLTEDTNHYMSARDIAILSRALTLHYPAIFNYTTIWMEDITHVTAQGSSPFTLANTNKLIRQYPYATGLKTGSTSIAKFCLSATAEKDGICMISVVLAAPDPKTRFGDSVTLLNYGFSVSRLYRDSHPEPLAKQPVRFGVDDDVTARYEKEFCYLDTENINFDMITRDIIFYEQLEAPVYEGDILGEAVYRYEQQELGRVNILAERTVLKATYFDCFKKAFGKYLL